MDMPISGRPWGDAKVSLEISFALSRLQLLRQDLALLCAARPDLAQALDIAPPADRLILTPAQHLDRLAFRLERVNGSLAGASAARHARIAP